MNIPAYSLPMLSSETARRSRRWLLLGVVALGVAGIFAGMLGGSAQSAFFHTALAVHVDLSVLVWFLTMACMLFALADNGKGIAMIADASFYCMALGAALIALSALTRGEAYMSNYIPVIHHPVFFLGLSLLLCSVMGMIANALSAHWKATASDAQVFGIVSAALIMLIAIGCFVLSARSLPADMTGQIYYEYAFWGGGHLLQFVHTQLMMLCWLWLAAAAGFKVRLPRVILIALYCFGLIAAAVSLSIYYSHGPASDEHRSAFTLLMKHGNGMAALVLGVTIVQAFFASHRHSAVSTLPAIMLCMSMLLFAAGGVLGYRIEGSNVTVPAHYHGSIVAVTLAYMGVAYALLPQFGYKDVARDMLARIQPLIYGGGQLCWMTGMALLGAHGAPRKTPGSAETAGALASFLKHGGDGLALIGGLLFVFVVLRAGWKKSEKVNEK